MAGADSSCPRITRTDHRITGRRPGTVSRHHSIGREVLQVVIDDASRLAYTEPLSDERIESALTCPRPRSPRSPDRASASANHDRQRNLTSILQQRTQRNANSQYAD